ncbi:MAG: hypothetical protein F4W91_10330 [Gemmatimonadetes bacterium]|nr:hypothetical protein [Gemmatimonadota bacterium]
MYMQSVLYVIAISIALISGRVSAQSPPAPADRASVVLEDSEIDSSKVEVGTYAEITYYKGEKLETVRGYIKAVDSEALTIGRGLWKEQIAFERIQTLIVGVSDRSINRYQVSIDLLKNKDPRSQRLVRKLFFGALTGFLSGVVGAGAASSLEGAYIGVGVGWLVGVPIGVSLADRHDRFALSLVGSVIGGAVGVAWIAYDERLWPSLIFFPLVGATIMSEMSRKPPDVSHFSIGLSSDANRRLFALATLRF